MQYRNWRAILQQSAAKCGTAAGKSAPANASREQASRMTCKVIAASGRRRVRQRRARSTGPPSCDRSPIGACTTGAKGRIENTAPAFRGCHRQGLRHRVRPAGGQGRHADGVPRRKLDRLLGVRGTDRRTPAREPRRVCATRARTIRTFSALPSSWTWSAAACRCWSRSRSTAPRRRRQLPRQNRAPGQGLQRARSRSCPSMREVVAALGRLAPTVPRGPVVGSHKLHPSWWTAPSAANRSASSRSLLGSAPAGIAFFAIDVRMLRSRAGLDDPAYPGAAAVQLDHPHGPRAQGGRPLGRRADLRGLRGVKGSDPSPKRWHRCFHVWGEGSDPDIVNSPRSPWSAPR